MKNKDDLARRIGSKVKELRKESGLPQKKLADATGLSSALLSRIENGLAMPSIPTLQVISDTLKAEIGYFFQDREEKGYIITNPGDRRVVVSRSRPHGIQGSACKACLDTQTG